MKSGRVEEIMASLKAFSKDRYYRSELLNEMFSLQDEMVSLAFQKDHVEDDGLRIWDVENHLDQMNQRNGHVADAELERFINESKTFCNIVKAEVSGYRGEAKAFYALQGVRSRNVILRNIELNDDAHRTELDAVVITPGFVTIVEVKNSPRSIFIDENGNYFKTGTFLKKDCNIAKKMYMREKMLGSVLERNGITDVRIRSVVVFTDDRIEVENRNHRLRTCFLSQLPYIIDGFECHTYRSYEELESIASVIKSAEQKIEYPFNFDIEQYKRDFAILLAKLEDSPANKEDMNWTEVEVDLEERTTVRSILSELFTPKRAAEATAAVLPVLAMALIKRGLFR